MLLTLPVLWLWSFLIDVLYQHWCVVLFSPLMLWALCLVTEKKSSTLSFNRNSGSDWVECGMQLSSRKYKCTKKSWNQKWKKRTIRSWNLWWQKERDLQYVNEMWGKSDGIFPPPTQGGKWWKHCIKEKKGGEEPSLSPPPAQTVLSFTPFTWLVFEPNKQEEPIKCPCSSQDSIGTLYVGTGAPSMHQGCFDWQCVSNIMASAQHPFECVLDGTKSGKITAEHSRTCTVQIKFVPWQEMTKLTDSVFVCLIDLG